MSDPTLHNLDNRVTVLERWKEDHVRNGIPRAEERLMLQIGNIIDEKLNKRFGWMSRMLEAIGIAVIVAVLLAIFGVG